MTQMGDATHPDISLVIPVFNEEAVLPALFIRLDALMAVIRGRVEILMVDDGSRDASAAMIVKRAAADPRYRYVGLSRNFGHQAAITAGMELAAGDAVIVMDADLQDPPETVLELIARWREGYEIVHARRRSRAGETRFKLWTASLFYRGLRALTKVDIPADVGDFRLVDRRAIETFRAMPEQDRFVRGMFGWMGYRQAVVEFDRDERAAGVTKYSLGKMVRLALDGVVGFSDVPLRLALWTGAIISLGSLLYGAYVVAMAIFGAGLVSGWASLAVLVSFLSGINLLMTGIVGVYVGRTHREVKQRPLYIVARDTGGQAAAAASAPRLRRVETA
ncbi:dolichol-phosphate mannosyltransferase [Sphingomonas laterariae]|uniref:Dolichol-phosphate mannosyltransferase n=1 Tax=Edaphosphingomonas laterariae TaxID=861865 RepID=A0A239D1Q1_9SPHN|nr:glycosyltransferase family 2 protein [Sphingomonas laterariae]SNS26456.1 dolichol-phosphate mannosyltransferase [Sphingomonas laterariae]